MSDESKKSGKRDTQDFLKPFELHDDDTDQVSGGQAKTSEKQQDAAIKLVKG